MTDAWRVVAALLVAGLSMLFAGLFLYQRRRVRYQLRNRLTPLMVLHDGPTPIERWLRWSIFGVVLVVALAALAFGGRDTMHG